MWKNPIIQCSNLLIFWLISESLLIFVLPIEIKQIYSHVDFLTFELIMLYNMIKIIFIDYYTLVYKNITVFFFLLYVFFVSIITDVQIVGYILNHRQYSIFILCLLKYILSSVAVVMIINKQSVNPRVINELDEVCIHNGSQYDEINNFIELRRRNSTNY